MLFALLLAIGALLIAITVALPNVGPSLTADGTGPAGAPRQGKTGEAIVGQSHGKYYEAVHRQNCYAASTAGSPAAIGNTIGTTAAFVIWNPLGSGKRLVIMKTTLGYNSGTLGAGTIFYCLNTSNSGTAPTGGTAITPTNVDAGSANNAVAKAGFNQTLVAAPTAVKALVSTFPELATTANAMQQIEDDNDGEFVIEPGNGISLQYVGTAGTSPKFEMCMQWEEVAII
jgi:hypothetical protein